MIRWHKDMTFRRHHFWVNLDIQYLRVDVLWSDVLASLRWKQRQLIRGGVWRCLHSLQWRAQGTDGCNTHLTVTLLTRWVIWGQRDIKRTRFLYMKENHKTSKYNSLWSITDFDPVTTRGHHNFKTFSFYPYTRINFIHQQWTLII